MLADVYEYSEVMENYLLEMEKIKTFHKEQISQAIVEMCRLLRIAKVQVEYYYSPQDEVEHKAVVDVFFEEGEADYTRPYKGREITNGGTITICSMFERKDGPAWDAEDLERVHVFQKSFFAYTGRMRLLDLLDKFTMTDVPLDVRNMTFVMKQIGQMIAQKKVLEFGYCYFNLKSFSLVNERVGRDPATGLMKEYVHRLQNKLAKPGVVGRIGGDNFVVMFLKDNLEIVRSHLHGEVLTYNKEAGESLSISAKAGYFLPEIRDIIRTPDDIMDRISSAMALAKSCKDTDEIFFSEEMERRRTEAKKIENSFPEAIRNNEFKVYYQPKVNLHDYHLVGAEALCRWIRNDHVISPGVFIPVLEQSANVCRLDFYMLEKVCRDIRRWLDDGKEPVRVSFNLSRRHLGDVDLLKHILDIIDGNRVPHEYIEVELTETTTDVEFNDLKKIVNGLHEVGIATSVDDFGTGYSSINLIREVPWNVLKLDKSFLPTAEDDKSYDSTMLRHVIAMAQDMGLECIVEGVETEEHVKLLQDCKCFMAQGFFFDRPMPVLDFEQRLARKNESFWPKKDC